MLCISCSADDPVAPGDPSGVDLSDYLTIDFTALPNYGAQNVPGYITKDNTPGNNPITDEAATLGRILFYDTNLSSDNTVSCASCHKQAFAFGDDEPVSQGVNGTTPRHSMRLVNSRFSAEARFFWDERASSLEAQTTMPIQSHTEMGFSGENGDLGFADLINKLNGVPYYPVLFTMVYGSTAITETNIQNALAQFVRSIQSFDSRYDAGRSQVNDDGVPFPNFTPSENAGKTLFMDLPVFDANSVRTNGGVGCAQCHLPPEFDIDPGSLSNSLLFAFGSAPPPNGTLDTLVTKSPTLRDMINPQGVVAPLMHNATVIDLAGSVRIYDSIGTFADPAIMALIDIRLAPNGLGQRLNLTPQEINDVANFMRTLSGSDVYSNAKWSDPFR